MHTLPSTYTLVSNDVFRQILSDYIAITCHGYSENELYFAGIIEREPNDDYTIAGTVYALIDGAPVYSHAVTKRVSDLGIKASLYLAELDAEATVACPWSSRHRLPIYLEQMRQVGELMLEHLRIEHGRWYQHGGFMFMIAS